MSQATTFALLGRMLLIAFVLCCALSAVLQLLAWTRHGRAGVPMSVRALWRPEGHFDEVGLRQIRRARRLLNVGIVAYVAFVALNVLAA